MKDLRLCFCQAKWYERVMLYMKDLRLCFCQAKWYYMSEFCYI